MAIYDLLACLVVCYLLWVGLLFLKLVCFGCINSAVCSFACCSLWGGLLFGGFSVLWVRLIGLVWFGLYCGGCDLVWAFLCLCGLVGYLITRLLRVVCGFAGLAKYDSFPFAMLFGVVLVL